MRMCVSRFATIFPRKRLRCNPNKTKLWGKRKGYETNKGRESCNKVQRPCEGQLLTQVRCIHESHKRLHNVRKTEIT